jgi:hypothetical protein
MACSENTSVSFSASAITVVVTVRQGTVLLQISEIKKKICYTYVYNWNEDVQTT